jgi:hypothetical protein
MRSPKKRTGRRTALRGVQFRTQRRTAQPLRAAPPSWRSNRRRHIVLRTRPGGVPTNERGTHRGQRTLRTHANNPQTHIPHAAPVALCHERTDVGTFWWRGKGGWGRGGALPRQLRGPACTPPARRPTCRPHGLSSRYLRLSAHQMAKPKKVHTSALCWVPAVESQPPIQALRLAHDRQIDRWPPHVNVLYPFVPEAEFEAAAGRLAAALQPLPAFRVTLSRLDRFVHGRRLHSRALPTHYDTPCASIRASPRLCTHRHSRVSPLGSSAIAGEASRRGWRPSPTTCQATAAIRGKRCRRSAVSQSVSQSPPHFLHGAHGPHPDSVAGVAGALQSLALTLTLTLSLYSLSLSLSLGLSLSLSLTLAWPVSQSLPHSLLEAHCLHICEGGLFSSA